MEQVNELVGGLILMGGFVGVAYFIARYTFLLRKLMMEKGLVKEAKGRGLTKRDVAGIVIGLGIGLMITAGLSTLRFSEDTMDLLGWGIVLIGGAVGFLISSKRQVNLGS